MKKPKHILQLGAVLILTLFVISANAQLHADFSSDVIKGCSPLVVQFSDKSTGNPAEWQWDLGNGTQSTNQAPSAIFFNTGTSTVTYTIKLVVKNNGGTDSVVKKQYISVYANPQVTFTSDITQGCPPFNIHFSDKSKAGSGTVTSWLWDFGEGVVSKEKNPLHTYTLPNTYTISLTATNSEGCKQTYSQQNYVQVFDTVKANFDYTYTSVCQTPAPVNFINHSASATPLSSFSWNFGDNKTGTENAPVHTYDNVGTYTVKLVATNNSGCKDTVTKNINIGKVGADFTFNSTSACTNTAVTFTNSSTTVPSSVKWDFGDGATATSISSTHTYASAGKYTVTMTASFGTCTSTTKKEITIQNRPSVAFDVPETGICQLPYKVQFTNNSTEAVKYNWVFGDGKVSTEINPAHVYTTNGFFDVKLVASSTNGCADSTIKKAAVRLGPPVIDSFFNLPVVGCVPQVISPKASITSAEKIVSYQWNFGDGTTSVETNPTHTYDKEGEYTVRLIVMTTSGCSDTFTLPKAVTAVNPPVANFSANPLNVCARTPVVFTDSSTGGITNWWWQFGDGGTSTLQNPLHKYGDTGYFKVALVVTNIGCSDTLIKEKYVHIRPPIAAFGLTMDCIEPFKRAFSDKSKGAQSWEWSFGDGTTAAEASPLHNYSATGIYNVQLIVKNEECVDTAKQTIRVVDEHPAFSYKLNGDAACRNDAVSFAAANFTGGNMSSFSWNFGDKTPVYTSANATLTHKYDSTGTFTPQLITTDVLGCKDTISSSTPLTVYGPRALFSNPIGVCIHSTANFTDSSKTDGVHPVTKWQWSYGESNTVTYNTAPFNHLYDSAGYFNVKLTIYDSYGCKDSVTKTKAIQVTNPIAEFTSATPIKCVNNNVSFIDKAVGESLTYSWNFGDNSASSTQAAPAHTYASEGLYTIKLSVKDKYGCVGKVEKKNFITISNPKASFNMNGPTEATCPPLLAKPTNTSTNATAVSWSFGDGAYAAIDTPKHVYTQGGIYALRLIAKGFGECYDTATQMIKLKGPSGSFSYDTLKGCKPTTVTFTAVTSNAVKVLWDYSDGNVDTGMVKTKKHTYNAYGQYIPKLLVTDNAGCVVGIQNEDTIHISGVKPAYAFNLKAGCDSSGGSFTNTSTPYWDAVKGYKWSFGDGSSSTAANPPAHIYKTAGKYNTKLVVNTENGCTDSLLQTVDVAVHVAPNISMSAPDSLCNGSLASLKAFNATKDSATTWQWTLNKTTAIGTTPNLSYQFKEAGSYILSAVATMAAGCADTTSKKVVVVAQPVVNAGLDTFVCKGNATLLTATGANSFAWNSTASLSCTNCAATMVSPSAASQYIVTGKNNFGCQSSDTVNVNVIEPVKITVQGDTLCFGETSTLKVDGAKLYNWSPAIYLSDATSNMPVFHATKDTTITYTVTGTDEKKCFSDARKITVKVYPIPEIDITDAQIDLNVGSSIKLNVKSSADITQWRWTPASFLSDATAESPIATPRQSMTYTCVASNNGSCYSRDQISINVMCNQANMFVPNTFSPNGDGINDRFFPRGQGVFNIKALRIFNRWGQLVFEKNNYLPNVEMDGWDGTFKGQPLPSDVYVYMLEITCDNNAVVPFKGNVTLLR